MASSVKPADAGVSVGEVFQGKYRVDAILGHGGMGVVAECTHLALNERVAIKMLRQDVLLDNDAVQRFIREAQAAAKLKSEYVARVTDVGTFENGVPYMVMEFLEGHDLGDLLQQRGVLPVPWAVELMLQTAEALAEAHSLGIVHRDVKPTNLFVTWRPDGSALIKVLDFGISKSPLGTDMHLTQTQSLLGTPAYMSPEQMRSARLVDSRTDIWSLGTVFYECLEGRRPFEAESFSEMCVKVAVDPPAPMVNTPPPLQQVVLRCLAKSPEQRYSSMAEFARDLVPFAADPHGAQMLVERMARMLRRSSYDWEGSSTGVGRQAIPNSVRDLGSGAVRQSTPSPQWGLGSDPAGVPWHAKSDPAGRPWHGSTPRGDASQPFARALNEASQPFARPYSEPSQPFARPLNDAQSAGVAQLTLRDPRKSRRWLIVAGLALLAVGAIAFGMFGTSDEGATDTSAAPASADTTQEMPLDPTEIEILPAAVPPDAQPAVPATDVADTPAPDGDSPAGVQATAKDAADDDSAGEPNKAAGKTGKAAGKTGKVTRGKPGRNVRPSPDKSTRTSSAHDRDKEKEKEKEKERAEPAKPTKPPCDPYASMHGC